MPKPRNPYTQLQAYNFPFNHSTFFHTHFLNPSKIKLFVMFRASTSVDAKSCKMQKKSFILHILINKKTPTAVGVKMCINAQFLQ